LQTSSGPAILPREGANYVTYLYEQLTPERFQQFCQALLTSQFPNAQCLPVGQPDGGRDAYLWSMRNSGADPAELIVFQIKFSRGPEKADADFIKSVIDTELLKVELHPVPKTPS
jgi:hypothetical protein